MPTPIQRISALLFVMATLAMGLSGWAGAQEKKPEQYKRIHQDMMRNIMDGHADKSLFSPDAPVDAETSFVQAVAFAQLKRLQEAAMCGKEALSRGLPPERFIAGPRGLLRPLVSFAPFESLLEGKVTEPIHGPMVGSVTHESARFWVRTARASKVKVVVSANEDLTSAVYSDSVTTSRNQDFTAVSEVRGLKPSTRYYYRVIVGREASTQTPHPSFRTYPAPGEAAQFSVAFGGGAGYVPQHEHMWDTIRALDPLAFLFLGDNVYIDTPGKRAMQEYCYYRRQSRPEFRKFVEGRCIYAIYDDHDFGDNDCWGGPDIEKPAWKRPVWETFTYNWVNPAYGGGEKQPGCWFTASIGDVDFIFLDCRYYRTNPKADETSMLGPVQKAWLLEQLANAKGTFKILVSSVPWAKDTKPGSLDTWDGYDAEREEIFSFIENKGINGILLLSADRHRSDIWKIERNKGYPFYEFESSRLTNQHVHDKMPGALFSYNESQSFELLTFDTTQADPQVTCAIINIDGGTVHEHTVKLSEISSKN